MNHMEEVAHMLGLELYENFRIRLDTKRLSHFEYRFTEKGLMRYRECNDEWDFITNEVFLNLLSGKFEVVNITKNILTEQERHYLSSVVKPFREKILHISKLSGKNSEYICIDIRYDWEEDSILLPRFATGTLYKGMEIGKEYSVKDLGL